MVASNAGGTEKRLQCGHDPKVVENDVAAVFQLAFTALQCGHDPKVVENGQPRFAAPGGRRASMRPRPEGRGEP